MKKRVLSILLTLVMLIGLMPLAAIPSFAETGDYSWPFGKGDGTAENPYTISSYNQLKRLANDVNGGADVTGLYFELTQPIITNFFTPIGTKDHPFKGHFDGGENIIVIRMNKPDTDYLGLFGYAEGAEIKNVCWQGTVAGHDYVGGICGYGKDTAITNCGYKQMWQMDGGVTATGSYVGSVCGYLENGSIANCTNILDVSGINYVGGICGYCENGTITNCGHKPVNVTGNSDTDGFSSYIGGICGCMINGSVSDCSMDGTVTNNGTKCNAEACTGGICGYTEGNVENCVNSAEVFGSLEKNSAGEFRDAKAENIGGICGCFQGTMRNCINKGTVIGFANVGGIIGQAYDAVDIINCYNEGEIIAHSGIVGGLAGNVTLASGDSIFINCINVGTVNIPSGTHYSGGLFGSVSSTKIVNCISVGQQKAGELYGSFAGSAGGITIENSYFDKDVFPKGIAEVSSIGNGAQYGRTTAEMKSAEMLASLNACAAKYSDLGLLTWKQGEDGYPCLDYPTANDGPEVDPAPINPQPIDPINPIGPIDPIDIQPVILTGADSKWKKGSKDSVLITSSGPYDELSAVYMDGKLIPEDGFEAFPALIAVADDEANLSRALEGKIAGVSVTANIGLCTPVQLVWSSINFMDSGIADSRFVEPERIIMFRVPWVDGQEIFNPALAGRAFLLTAYPVKDNTKDGFLPVFGFVDYNPSLKSGAHITSDNAAQALQGKVAGMTITTNDSTGSTPQGNTESDLTGAVSTVSGSPAGTATIQIRGLGAFNDNNPLIIVDGLATDGSPAGTGTVRIRSVRTISGDAQPLYVTDGIENEHSGANLFVFDTELYSNGEGTVLDISAFTGIELKPEYLETLSVGSHTLKLVYTDGTELSAHIEIKPQKVSPKSPQTGYEDSMALWMEGLLISSLGLAACLVFGRKKKAQ